MKITIYTITDCQFSKQEKEYLASHNLPYEEKNLELNKEWLTEMLAVSNNFAGTPVTRIEKDDGSIQVFKGFTKEEFDNFFGFTPPQTTVSQPVSQETSQQETPQIEQKQQQTLQESSPTNPVIEKPAQETPTSSTTPNDSTSSMNQPNDTTAKVDEKLGSVLDKLEEKTEETQPTPPIQTPTQQTPPPSNPPPTDLPNIPDFNSSDNQ